MENKKTKNIELLDINNLEKMLDKLKIAGFSAFTLKRSEWKNLKKLERWCRKNNLIIPSVSPHPYLKKGFLLGFIIRAPTIPIKIKSLKNKIKQIKKEIAGNKKTIKIFEEMIKDLQKKQKKGIKFFNASGGFLADQLKKDYLKSKRRGEG